jgi:hypothetical protein
MESLADISVWITATLSSLAAGLVKKGLGFVDNSLAAARGEVGKVDVKWVQFVKSFMPAIVAVFAVAIPMLASALGLTEIPTADAMGNAPLATVLAVILRELIARFVKPLLPVTPTA